MHSPDIKIPVINCLASDVIKGHIMNLNLGTYWLPTWNTFWMTKIDKDHCFLTALQMLKVQYLLKVNKSCDFVSLTEKNCISKNSFLFYTCQFSSWLRELKIGFRILVKVFYSTCPSTFTDLKSICKNKQIMLASPSFYGGHISYFIIW